MNNNISRTLAFGACRAAVLMVPPAIAQVTEEVTVTAQRRDANLQEVPISVSAFGPMEDMQKLQIECGQRMWPPRMCPICRPTR